MKLQTNLKVCGILLIGAATLTGCNSGGSSAVTPKNSKSHTGADTNNYEIVIDSGSKGNRVYLYSYNATNAKTTLDLNIINLDPNDTDANKNDLPLAGYASNPMAAGNEAVKPLLTIAEAKLSALGIEKSTVEVVVQGTAGMRLISQAEQDAIWSNVTETVSNEGFSNSHVGTLPGNDEGLDSWIDYNFLNNKFAATKTSTNGLVEIGGASAQVAFDTPSASADHVRTYTILGQTYNVYSISYLGLGANQARLNGGQVNSCYPNGYSEAPITGTFNYSSCNDAYNTFLGSNNDIATIEATKNIAGFADTHFAGLGDIWDTAKLVSNSPTEQALKKAKRIKNNPLTQSSLTSAITAECARSLGDITTDFGDDAADAPTFCANAVYADNLVFKTLGINDGNIQGYNKVTLPADASEVKINWTLGYVLDEHFANVK